MDVLAELDQLEAIEINSYRSDGGTQPLKLKTGVLFNPTRRFFALLEGRHPYLRRILLAARHAVYSGITFDLVLWRRSEGWSPRRMPYLEYWDIVNGKLGD